MSSKLFKNTVEISRFLIESMVKKGNVVVDATVGNGNDILLLADLVGDSGEVYGFDIQYDAIINTEKKLKERNLHKKVMLINDGHENIKKYVLKNLDFVIFNLGYLPGGDHNIITRPCTTIKSLESSLTLLNPGGHIVVTSYYGHPGGCEEKIAVEKFLTQLEQKKYNVLKFSFINQVNNPPILYCIEKTK